MTHSFLSVPCLQDPLPFFLSQDVSDALQTFDRRKLSVSSPHSVRGGANVPMSFVGDAVFSFPSLHQPMLNSRLEDASLASSASTSSEFESRSLKRHTRSRPRTLYSSCCSSSDNNVKHANRKQIRTLLSLRSGKKNSRRKSSTSSTDEEQGAGRSSSSLKQQQRFGQ